jgi:hypothetical protein
VGVAAKWGEATVSLARAVPELNINKPSINNVMTTEIETTFFMALLLVRARRTRPRRFENRYGLSHLSMARLPPWGLHKKAL